MTDRCSAESESLGRCHLPAGHDGIHWTTDSAPDQGVPRTPKGTPKGIAELRQAWRESVKGGSDDFYSEFLEGEIYRLRAELETLRKTLDWVALRYATTLAGKPVRDADECLERARLVLYGSPASDEQEAPR